MITVEKLYEALKKQMEIGNAKKIIVLANDEEGNEFHICPYLLVYKPNEVKEILDSTSFEYHNLEATDIVILG